MERGVYFDGWYRNSWNIHPTLPPRRLQMLEDLEEMGATALVWAGLGGGVISLPYLEDEAFGEIPERFRTYGYVNDSEFIAHCREAGIDLFAIVFQMQAWGVPAEIVEGQVKALVERRGTAPVSEIGLTAFANDDGPANWKPFAHYFPKGLTNSAGERVTDLQREVASHGLDGEPYHTIWVEAPLEGMSSYLADRNNPVWREYLKAIIRLQIDAGAPGVQLDEANSSHLAFGWGGCFCRDCCLVFRAWLLAQPAEKVPAEVAGVDLTTFDYRAWLLARGHRQGENPRTFPLYEQYWWAIMANLHVTSRELSDYARVYAASQGKRVRLGSNFFNCDAYYDAFIDDVDMIVTETAYTLPYQPWFYRHCVGFARGKDVIAVEGPYSGEVERLNNQLKVGKAYDLFRISIFEANAMGANMALPYGSWLGTGAKDAYWAPRDLAVETGQFIKAVAPYTTNVSPHRTAVLFTARSQLLTYARSHPGEHGDFFPGLPGDEINNQMINPFTPYWLTLEALSRAGKTYDVITLPEESVRPGGPTAADLSRYSTVVLPVGFGVSATQHAELVKYLDDGGRLVLVGEYATDLPDEVRAEVSNHPGTTFVAAPAPDASAAELAGLAGLVNDVVDVDLGGTGAASVHALAGGEVAIHLLNVDYRAETDGVTPKRDVRVTVRLDRAFSSAKLIVPGAAPQPLGLTVTPDGAQSFTVDSLGVYAIIHLMDCPR
ncbi:MAG: hypothetical protein FWG11_05305 [Promicromonosporaceae bacterium]|nr:hypothetical protein [Promicromonosporaceae bacterium]